MISSISFTSVMFVIVRVLESIFGGILLVRDIELFVVIQLINLVLYMYTESGFFVVRSRDDGSIIGLKGSWRNILSLISRYPPL